jgi:two-component system, cell cycle sensor histidine kinase and response regulator CckA
MSHGLGCNLDGSPRTTTAILGRRSEKVVAPPLRCFGLSAMRTDTCAVLKCTGDVIVWMDSAGRIAFASPSIQQRWGYSPMELLGRRLDEVVASDAETIDDTVIGGDAEGWNGKGAGKSRWSGRLCVRCKDGRTCIAHVVCAPVGETQAEQCTLLTFHDLTETVQREKALRESEERFSKAFACSPTPIGISMANDGRYVDVNSALLRLLGYERTEIIGSTSSDLGIWVSPEAHSHFTAELRLRGRIVDCEASFRAKSGGIKQVVIAAELIQLDGQDAVLAVIQDVTEAKLLEAQFLQSQKMEAVGRLAGGIAHDFNNILGVILGYAELAQDQAENNSGLVATLEQIKAAAQKASGLTRQLLAFTHKQPASFQRLDLNEVVRSTLQLLKRIVGKDITIGVHAGKGTLRIEGDRTQVEQILMNLAANARDAMPNGGQITINTGLVQPGGPQAPRRAEAGQSRSIKLTFQDTGCGMDQETQLHIFEPFFTTKPPGSGTGLGLSTVYSIVQQNGGTVSVESEPGKGSTFTFCFPAAAGRTLVRSP